MRKRRAGRTKKTPNTEKKSLKLEIYVDSSEKGDSFTIFCSLYFRSSPAISVVLIYLLIPQNLFFSSYSCFSAFFSVSTIIPCMLVKNVCMCVYNKYARGMENVNKNSIATKQNVAMNSNHSIYARTHPTTHTVHIAFELCFKQ